MPFIFMIKKYCRSNQTPDKIKDIVIADQECVKEFSTSPRTYGGVELSQEEENLLTLPPKYSIPTEINIIDCQTEVEKSLGKMRWELHKESMQITKTIKIEHTLM